MANSAPAWGSCASAAASRPVRAESWLNRQGSGCGYPLCDRALGIDPNNVLALNVLAIKYYMPVDQGTSADPKADLKRVGELLSQSLALDPTSSWAHDLKAWTLNTQARFEEAIVEREGALALDPANVSAMHGMGFDYFFLGQYEKSLELFNKAIRLSPRDPLLQFMYTGKSWAYFGLKQYDRAIDSARRAIALGTSPFAHANLIAALALTGHEAEAREALQDYLALPSSAQLRTIAALKAYYSHKTNSNTDPGLLESYEREYEGLRSRDAGGVKQPERGLRERVRCSSLIDWPVYARLSALWGTRRAHAIAATLPLGGKPRASGRYGWRQKGIGETDSLAAPKRTSYASQRGIGSLPIRRNSRSRLPASARPRRKPGAPHVHRLRLRKGQG
jgi:tetratricopeptide (TPR) repeat protein